MVNNKSRKLVYGSKLLKGSNKFITKKDVYNLDTRKFLYSKPIGFFIPVKRKRRIC